MTPRLSVRAIGYGLAAGIATVLVIGIPTVVIPNPFFSRMIPTRTQDYVFLAITAILAAVLAATYAYPATCRLQEGKWVGGGFLSFLAVGCPVCNKVVLLLLGSSGALTYFEPVQPLLAFVGIGLLGLAVSLRIRAIAPALSTMPVTTDSASAELPAPGNSTGFSETPGDDGSGD